MKKQRYDLEKIKKQCIENNLEFISIIEGPKNKVQARCNNCNFLIERTMDKWNLRQHCTNCNKIHYEKNNLEERKNTFINFLLEKNEFKYIDGFIDDSTKVKLKHIACNNIIEITPNHLKQGRGCKFCNGGVKYSHNEYIKKFYETHDRDEYIVIGEYKGSKELIEIKHNKCGFTFKVNDPTRVSNLGTGCPYCSGAVKKPIGLIKEEIKKIDNDFYELVDSFYENGYVNLKHKKCGTSFTAFLPNFLNKNWSKCPTCYPAKKSIPEIEVKEFIESLGFKAQSLKKKIDNKKYEIDIYIEELKIGIEFDGLYWHSDGINDDKLNLNKKRKAYEKEGIRIINIFEDEWKYKRNLVETKLKNILGVSDSKKIYARKCEIKKINSKERNKFLEETHIQGSDRASISYGLFFENEIVGIMSFSKLRPALGHKTGSDSYELSRYSTKYNVVGGFSKLLKHIIEIENINHIITYADLRWSSENSNVYTKNGFIKKQISNPNYWYFNRSSLKRYHRYNFRKQVLKEKFPEFYDDSLTEHQIMDKTNYRRIWDCGNLVYEWKRKDD